MRPSLVFYFVLFAPLASPQLAWGDDAAAPMTAPVQPVTPAHGAEADLSPREAPLAPTAATVSDCTYQAGLEHGRQDVKQEGSWGWGAAGAGTACASGMLGCFTLGPVLGAGCGGMGCLAATGAAYLFSGEAKPAKGGCFEQPEYATGYAEGYEKAMAQQNALYAFAGGVIGAVAAVPLSLTLFFTAMLGGAAL